MDREALDVILAQLDEQGRGALRHLLANTVTPLVISGSSGVVAVLGAVEVAVGKLTQTIKAIDEVTNGQ